MCGFEHTNYGDVMSFYKGKRVFISGNTGFKGAWMTHILLNAGATVIGYALEPSTTPALFTLAGIDKREGLKQIYADVRDFERMQEAFKEYQPGIVFHLAAQPIVRDSYRNPVKTYSTNVMGTVNILECVRQSCHLGGEKRFDDYFGVESFLNVTTDKVYKNNEWCYGYREIDPLDGLDPYSNSKSCSELVTHSYKKSFFSANAEKGKSITKISTARAGNVIGGGDFSNDRIIPDCVRTLFNAREKDDRCVVGVRNPYSKRPYQHVLEPIFAYLLIAYYQCVKEGVDGCYNVGPDDVDCVTTGKLVELFKEFWNESGKIVFDWSDISDIQGNAPYEANLLKLNCDKIKTTFGWAPRWNIEEAIKQTISFTKVIMDSAVDEKRVREEMDREVEAFLR